MTNEEAINMLKSKMDSHTDTSYEWTETVRMAIKALEQQPCEDCISRQALIEKATSWDKHFADSERYVSLTDIQKTPSVIPQTKKGKWILNDVQGVQAVGYLTYHCSECGREINSKYHGKISLLNEYPYCHCGARMDADMREVQG